MDLQASDQDMNGAASPAHKLPQLPTPRFVTFHVGSDEYAIHASLVSHVTAPLDPTPLPESPVSVRGIAAVKGEIVALVEPFGERGPNAANLNAKPKAIVLRSPQPGEQVAMAFNVDRIDEMIAVPYRSVRQPSDESSGFYIAEVEDRRFRIVEWSRLANLLERS